MAIGSFSIFGNTTNGNLNLQDNTGAIQVFNNSVARDLRCEDNSSITGGMNTAEEKRGSAQSLSTLVRSILWPGARNPPTVAVVVSLDRLSQELVLVRSARNK